MPGSTVATLTALWAARELPGVERVLASEAAHLSARKAAAIRFSGHKWLYQPKESAAVLFADADAAHAALSHGDPYLAAPKIGVLGSHGAGASLALAATLLAWGRAGLAARLERGMELAAELVRRVQGEPSLELWGPAESGIVLWRPRRTDLCALREHLRGVMVSLGRVGDELWLRSVPANPDADVGVVVEAVLGAARRVATGTRG